MFEFAHKEYLYLLLIIPIIGLLFLISWKLRKNAIKRFGNNSLVTKLMNNISSSRPVIKSGLILFALASLIIAIAGPQVGSKLQDIKRDGVELIIALDISNSMLANDIKPNRLDHSKRAISKLLDKLHNDKFGLVVFAGDAYVQLPLTTDYAAAKMFLSTTNTRIISNQGTAIGAALELAAKGFTSDIDKNKAIIVITDGENHEDDAIEKAAEIAENGIIIHTIGMGLPKGAPIPIGNPRANNFRTDRTGQVVITKLDETMLQQIASAGEGKYIRANNSQTGLKKLFDEINKMSKSEIEANVYSEYDEQFQYFIAFALLLLLLEFVILNRKNKYFKNVNFFGQN